jgi:hypothetical protein
MSMLTREETQRICCSILNADRQQAFKATEHWAPVIPYLCPCERGKLDKALLARDLTTLRRIVIGVLSQATQ